MIMKRLLFILALFSLSYSSLLWESDLGGEINTQPVVLGNRILIGSTNGNVYALAPSNGQIMWESRVGTDVIEIIRFESSAIAATHDGKISRLTTSGGELWNLDLSLDEYNVSTVFGLVSANNQIYATTDMGVYAINTDGSGAERFHSFNGTMTPPAAGDGFLIFGAGDHLVKQRFSGNVEWERSLDEGSFWHSRPALSGSTAYVGALDNSLHSFRLQGGYPDWEVKTGNWVLSTPLVGDDAIYFGSNDGNIYSVDPTNGQVQWESSTNLAVESKLISGFMGGTKVVFVASTDRNTYAMDTATGNVLWEGSATDWAMTPLFYQNKVIFGSHDGSVYAYSTERACSIIDPVEGDVVGKKELFINGRYVSEAGNAKIFVKLNDGPWEEVNVLNGSWSYSVLPEESFEAGLNLISCKVVDAAGEETGERYTTTGISYDSTIPLSDMVVKISPERIEDEPFTIYFSDGDDGSPVRKFNLSINGQFYTGNGSVNLTLPAGDYPFEVEKVGFNTYDSQLSVESTGPSPLFIIGGGLIVVVLLYLIWTKLIEPYRKKATRQ